MRKTRLQRGCQRGAAAINRSSHVARASEAAPGLFTAGHVPGVAALARATCLHVTALDSGLAPTGASRNGGLTRNSRPFHPAGLEARAGSAEFDHLVAR